jgi:hypothetical protein
VKPETIRFSKITKRKTQAYITTHLYYNDVSRTRAGDHKTNHLAFYYSPDRDVIFPEKNDKKGLFQSYHSVQTKVAGIILCRPACLTPLREDYIRTYAIQIQFNLMPIVFNKVERANPQDRTTPKK